MANLIETLKRQAAAKAVEQIESGMVIGLGTGSTAVYAVRAVGERLADGRLRDIVAIPTSEETARLARAVNVPLTTLQTHPRLDLTIDGADEIDPQLNLIKGLGGALLREKIVAVASQRLLIVADERKRVARLGMRAPLPVEVIAFAERPLTDFLSGLGARVVQRRQNNEMFITDEGNVILDCYFEQGLPDPDELNRIIHLRPGVVEHGLFLGLATEAIVAARDGVTLLTRGETGPR